MPVQTAEFPDAPEAQIGAALAGIARAEDDSPGFLACGAPEPGQVEDWHAAELEDDMLGGDGFRYCDACFTGDYPER